MTAAGTRRSSIRSAGCRGAGRAMRDAARLARCERVSGRTSRLTLRAESPRRYFDAAPKVGLARGRSDARDDRAPRTIRADRARAGGGAAGVRRDSHVDDRSRVRARRSAQLAVSDRRRLGLRVYDVSVTRARREIAFRRREILSGTHTEEASCCRYSDRCVRTRAVRDLRVPWRVDSLTDELVVSGGIVSGGDSVRARMRRAAATALLTAILTP